MTTGFGAGVGRSREEICGILSGSIMLIGLKYGRTNSTEDDKGCMHRVAAFRDEFKEIYGTTQCSELLQLDLGSEEDEYPCYFILEQTANRLLELLDDEAS